MQQRTVKIPIELFHELVCYFVFGKQDLHENIKEQINRKIDKLAQHELYSESVNQSLSEEQRTRARQEYITIIKQSLT